MHLAPSGSIEFRHADRFRPRWRRRALAFLLGTCLLSCTAQALATQAQTREPALQLQGEDFPELLIRLPDSIPDTEKVNPECGHIRARRLDELSPPWREVVERLHFDCEPDSLEAPEEGGIVTTVIAFLKPGYVQFRHLPVREVRMMDATQWGDHQYVLDKPYVDIGERLANNLRGSCQARRDVGDIRTVDCNVTQRTDGLYQQLDEITGIWVHPDPEHTNATIYAEAWSD